MSDLEIISNLFYKENTNKLRQFIIYCDDAKIIFFPSKLQGMKTLRKVIKI